MAVVVIAGGHDPHGVFQFSLSSLAVKTPASNSTVQLTVVRRQGNIGNNIIVCTVFIMFFVCGGERDKERELASY